MGRAGKIALVAGIGAAIVGGVNYVLRLNKTANELVIVPKLMLHKVTLQGITIRVDVRFKNPTKSQIKMKYPFLSLIYKDSVIGSSQAVDKDILIPAFGEAVADHMMVDIPLLGVFSLAGDLLKAVESGEGVKMKVRTMTTISLGWRKQPYQDVQEVTLKKDLAA